jgi:selenide,water dikinase
VVGLETNDDAGVYRVADHLAIVQTVDFFSPVVDDPFTYGKIAAVNALSDVYAMGGRPVTALNIVAVPELLPPSVLSAILLGGADALREAGVALLGGHTVTNPEPKYGLSVTGLVDPDQLVRNVGARPGDALILTKPIGIGVVVTAMRGDLAKPAQAEAAVQVMLRSNGPASELFREVPVHACTDITGFGLLGHALEMAEGSGVTLAFSYSALPVLDGAWDYARMGLVAGGAYRNKQYAEKHVSYSADFEDVDKDLLFDPQTSGGLLIAVDSANAPRLVERLHEVGDLTAVIVGRVDQLGDKYLVVED